MPLYFVLSGFFFKAYGFRIFLIKKINNIFVPFLFWVIVSDIMYGWHIQEVYFTIVQFIKQPSSKWLYSNIPLWFLICLFTTNAVFYLIYSVFKDNKTRCFASLFLAFVGYLLFRYNINLPLWMNSALIAFPFFFMGYCCRSLQCLQSDYPTRKSLFLGIGFIFIAYNIYYAFNHPCIDDMRSAQFHGNPILGYLNSFTFVMGVLLLCKVVKWLPIISYFGRYSIIVLCIHMPILMYLPGIIERRLGYTITTGEFTPIVFLICWLSIPLCKKCLPYFVAQKPLFKITEKKNPT